MSRATFSAKPFVVALAGAALIGAASGAIADRLLPAAAMPEARLTLVSNAGARAFDHIRAARQQIEVRQAFEARQELAQARKLLSEARAAVPANRVQDRIAALLRRVEDPSVKLSYRDVDPIYAEIEAARGGDAYAATWRYVERARFQLWNQDRNAATRELLAASARVPYGRIDGPLGASYERVNQAMILLYDLDLAGADALLAAAEDNAHAVVQIAAGIELPMEEPSAPDVAAPAAPMTTTPEIAPAPEIAPETLAPAATESEIPAATESEIPAATESEIPAGSEFQESATPEPAIREGLPATAEEAVQQMTPALPDVSAPELTAPEIPAEAASEAAAEATDAATEATDAATEATDAATEATDAATEATDAATEAASEAAAEATEAASEATGAATEATEAATEASEAAAEAAEAATDASKAAAEATEAAEAAERAAEGAIEGAVQEMTPALPDVAAPPAPEVPAAVPEIPEAAGEAAEDAIEEMAPEAQP